MIHYTIFPKDLAGHLFEVSVTVQMPAATGQQFALPAWIPGSYMIREFARNIIQIRATSAGKAVPLTKLDKHSWQAAPCDGALTLHYEVYAWDHSVRSAYLDQRHGFFNGTSVFLRVLGQEDTSHIVDIQRPTGDAYTAWRVATALPELQAKRYGFGTYIAANYDELIDHPVALGSFVLGSFTAHGVTHDVAINGRVPNLDMARLCADLQKICETQIAFFEPKTRQAPMSRYVFLVLATGNAYGGLEHRASCSLICSRDDLPLLKNHTELGSNALIESITSTDGYYTFLGLCSHEYFHTWNVKRIKPAAFAPYPLQTESYTSLLWLFEGVTSYYDDLMLLRSGVIDEKNYLKLLSQTINRVLQGGGRHKQSVADSSFDAWTKYYRQDENAPNAIVSYYTKGCLIALALDLTIRHQTQGQQSLDDVMRALWQRYGRDFYALDQTNSGLGIGEAEAEALFEEISGVALHDFFQRYIHGTEDLPLARLLAPFGITLNEPQGETKTSSLNIRAAQDGNDCKLAHVYENGAAHQAGLSAGDIVLAIDGLRVSQQDATNNLASHLSRYSIDSKVVIHVFRGDELMVFDVILGEDQTPHVNLSRNMQQDMQKQTHAAWL